MRRFLFLPLVLLLAAPSPVSGPQGVLRVDATTPLSTAGSRTNPTVELDVCSEDQVYRVIDGAWACFDPPWLESVNVSLPLTGTGTAADPITISTCFDSQILQTVMDTWQCVDMPAEYSLPAATATALGGIKGDGADLTCDVGQAVSGFAADGTLQCVDTTSAPPANMMTTDSDQDVTGSKTLVNKYIYFKDNLNNTRMTLQPDGTIKPEKIVMRGDTIVPDGAVSVSYGRTLTILGGPGPNANPYTQGYGEVGGPLQLQGGTGGLPAAYRGGGGGDVRISGGLSSDVSQAHGSVILGYQNTTAIESRVKHKFSSAGIEFDDGTTQTTAWTGVAPAPANMVTTNTLQTITGAKNIRGDLRFINELDETRIYLDGYAGHGFFDTLTVNYVADIGAIRLDTTGITNSTYVGAGAAAPLLRIEGAAGGNASEVLSGGTGATLRITGGPGGAGFDTQPGGDGGDVVINGGAASTEGTAAGAVHIGTENTNGLHVHTHITAGQGVFVGGAVSAALLKVRPVAWETVITCDTDGDGDLRLWKQEDNGSFALRICICATTPTPECYWQTILEQ